MDSTGGSMITYTEGTRPAVVDGEHLPDCPSLLPPVITPGQYGDAFTIDSWICSGCLPVGDQS